LWHANKLKSELPGLYGTINRGGTLKKAIYKIRANAKEEEESLSYKIVGRYVNSYVIQKMALL
jgi:hypothetical protein